MRKKIENFNFVIWTVYKFSLLIFSGRNVAFYSEFYEWMWSWLGSFRVRNFQYVYNKFYNFQTLLFHPKTSQFNNIMTLSGDVNFTWRSHFSVCMDPCLYAFRQSDDRCPIFYTSRYQCHLHSLQTLQKECFSVTWIAWRDGLQLQDVISLVFIVEEKDFQDC